MSDPPTRFAVPDSNRPWLFQAPEEPPPGLEAIRSWLRKPRPRLRRWMGWIPQILSGFADAWDVTKEKGPSAGKWIGRAAKKAEPAARAAAKLGQGIRKVGVRISETASAFRAREGKRREAEANVRKAGDTAQRYGNWIAAFAGVAETAFSVLSGLAELFKPDPPIQVNLRESDEPDDVPDDAPAPDGRMLPRPPPKRLPEVVPDEAPPVPAPREDLKPDDHPAAAPAEPPHRPAAPDDDAPVRAPARPPRQPAADPDPAPAPHARTENRPPSPARQPKPDDRLKGLPKVLHPRVRALGERASREVLYPLILDICHMREWTTAKQLAGWVSMHQRSLVHRHLGPMVDAGLLVLQFPDSPRSPRQAYRTHPEKWPPSN